MFTLSTYARNLSIDDDLIDRFGFWGKAGVKTTLIHVEASILNMAIASQCFVVVVIGELDLA